ncbi:MAG: glycosyltransferase family 2 protein [Alphaproteobacteria bacterium]|nr:glycosyltransferase family 2 protein [Alphaproteobacteria bacterium]
MTSHSPNDQVRLSVVMPVRNALPHLDAAISSILGQSFGDFEFVIGDDGSTDGSFEALQAWAGRDARIRLFRSDQRLGPARSSNWVVGNARAPIIARMDGDDIVHPERLERQLKILDRHPETALVGALWTAIDQAGRPVRPRDGWRLARRSPFAPFPHGSIMFRRIDFDRIGGYRPECDYWEDLDLFLRFAARAPVLVLPDALYQYRVADTSTRLASDQERVENAVDLMYRCMEDYRMTGSYEDLLAAEDGRAPQRLRPETFTSLGSSRLWAGRKPQILRRLWQRGQLGVDQPTAKALVWALWAELSPKSLRLVLQTLVRLRDRRVARRFADGKPHPWAIPKPTGHTSSQRKAGLDRKAA